MRKYVSLQGRSAKNISKNVFQGGGANAQKTLTNLKNPQNFKTFAIFLDFQGGASFSVLRT